MARTPPDDPFAALGGLDLPAGTPAPERTPAATPGPALPDPVTSAWIARYRELGGEVPRSPTLGQLVQRSDALARALDADGRRREAAELRQGREAFVRDRAQRAWAAVKARFAELDLPEKAYRALKQEDMDPEAILPRLRGARGEALRGAGAARLRDHLRGTVVS
jgi:hypothetical protein